MKFKNIYGNNNFLLIPTEFYLRSFYPDFKMQTHSHSYFEIMYAVKGDFVVVIQQENHKSEYKVSEGQFIFLDSEIIHNLLIPKNCKICNLEINMVYTTMTKFNANSIMNDIPCIHWFKDHFEDFSVINDTQNVLATIKQIHESIIKKNNDLDSFYLEQSLVLNLFIDISRCFQYTHSNTKSIYIAKALNLIENEFHQNITPKSIASILNISESYLHRLFKLHMNTSIVHVINAKRIELAKQLLIQTNDSIIDIAIAVGFNTRQNFTKQFIKSEKITPIKYRIKNRNKEYSIANIPKQQKFHE